MTEIELPTQMSVCVVTNLHTQILNERIAPNVFQNLDETIITIG